MRVALLMLAVVGCQQEILPTPAPTPVVPAPVPVPIATTPFAVNNQLVGEDGTIVKTLDGVNRYTVAVPDGPHRFVIGDVVVDTETGAMTKRIPDAAIIDDKNLVRYEPDGKVRWSVPVSGARSVRPPDIAIGSGRVIITINYVVHAFDDANGREVWTAKLPGYRLQIKGALAYTTWCNSPTKDHWLIGTDVVTGVEKFRTALPMDCDPWLDVEDDFLIVTEDHPAKTQFFSLDGKLLLELDEQAQGTRQLAFGKPVPVGDLKILATDKHLIALDRHAKVVWKRDHMHNTFVAGTQATQLPDGDLLIANFGQIDDSGVDILRLHPDGSQVWHSCATGLGVGHSEYEHFAYVEPRGDELFVVSQGSYGQFLERMSVKTGDRELRCVLHAEQDVKEGCTKPPPCPQAQRTE
ncbi:MAG: PQQ-binding-like beta-propeller repeat protein [Kofleriaceae bacterium]